MPRIQRKDISFKVNSEKVSRSKIVREGNFSRKVTNHECYIQKHLLTKAQAYIKGHIGNTRRVEMLRRGKTSIKGTKTLEMMMMMLSTEINGIASFPEMTPSNLLTSNLNYIKMFLFTGRRAFAKSFYFTHKLYHYKLLWFGYLDLKFHEF